MLGGLEFLPCCLSPGEGVCRGIPFGFTDMRLVPILSVLEIISSLSFSIMSDEVSLIGCRSGVVCVAFSAVVAAFSVMAAVAVLEVGEANTTCTSEVTLGRFNFL